MHITQQWTNQPVDVRVHIFCLTLQRPLTDANADYIVTIDTFPDEVLLEIFDFCVEDNEEDWKTLVHVCQRWRGIVFSAPHRLDLRLAYTGAKPVKEMLDIWPTLPIAVRVIPLDEKVEDDFVIALKQHDRICEIHTEVYGGWDFDILVESTERLFPALTELRILSPGEFELVAPDSFLGGSAPRLQSLWLKGIAFPALPNLLVSATDHVQLRLMDIPPSGYISPKVMAHCLSSLTRLMDLQIQCESAQPLPDQPSRRLPPRTIFPDLTHFFFQGAIEYLEVLFARLDAPCLQLIDSRFLGPPVFNISPFLGCTEPLKGLVQAGMFPENDFVDLDLSTRDSLPGRRRLTLTFRSINLVWHLPFLNQSTRRYTDVRELEGERADTEGDDMSDARWLQLLRLLTAVEDLYLPKELALWIALALREVGRRRLTEVLPALQNIYISGVQHPGPIQEAIGEFIAARELSGHPVSVQRWEGNSLPALD